VNRPCQLFLLLIAFTICNLSCGDDNFPYHEYFPQHDLESVIVKSSVSGIVVDENSAPLEAVQIKIGENIIETDYSGYFTLKDINVDAKGTLVSANASGYFSSFKMLMPSMDKPTFTKIILSKKELTAAINAKNSSKIELPEGGKITFSENSFQNKNGDLYSDIVYVYAQRLDPSDLELNEKMPGDLRGIDGDFNSVQLASFGMMNVEIEDQSGEQLNLSPGKNAILEFPLPPEMQATANATIPMWYFDEERGNWLEEGSASLSNGKYIGEVEHFSWWNCDVAIDWVDFRIKIVNNYGSGVNNIKLIFTLQSTGQCATGFTNSKGEFSCRVPKNAELGLKFISHCGSIIQNSIIGPYSQSTVIDDFPLDIVNGFITVNGILHSCDNQPIESGYIKINTGDGNNFVDVEQDGTFSATVAKCSETLSISGVDYINLNQSSTVSHDITSLDFLDIGSVPACINLDGYFIYSIDGNDYISYEATAKIEAANNQSGTLLVLTSNIPGLGSSVFNIDASENGIYNPNFAIIYSNSTQINCQDCESIIVEILEYGELGNPIIGNISGTIGNSSNSSEINGEFEIILRKS
jgi:hypothetical protein